MPKRSSKEDASEIAFRVAGESTRDSDETPKPPVRKKNPAAVALGRMGGKKGGKARAEKLSPEQRREIAKKAAAKRWRREGDGESGTGGTE